MGVSPESYGESKKETSESERKLTDILLSPKIIDRFATLKEFSVDTHLVAGFAIYKNGIVGDIIVPDEVGNDGGCCEQVDFNCQMFETENPEEVYMVIHTHPTKNKHCLKAHNEDLLAPTIKDIKDWYSDEMYNQQLIGGVLVCDGYCSLKLFNYSPKIKADMNMCLRLDCHFGDERTVAAKEMDSALIMCNIGHADINLDCSESVYKRRVKKASHQLLGYL